MINRLGDEGFAPTLSSDDRTLLVQVLGRSHEVAEMSARQRALHGSPHGFNVLMVGGEPMFIDFETVCYGPIEWDLCHLDPSVTRQYPPGCNLEALGLARLVVSAMTSALCWEGVHRGEDMRLPCRAPPGGRARHVGLIRIPATPSAARCRSIRSSVTWKHWRQGLFAGGIHAVNRSLPRSPASNSSLGRPARRGRGEGTRHDWVRLASDQAIRVSTAL